MKAIHRITSLIVLICSCTIAGNNIDAELSNTLSRISRHSEVIRNEARNYLESGEIPANMNEETSVIIRKTCLNRLERKERSGSEFSPFLKNKNPEQEREKEIKQALEKDDQRKLSEFAVELITTQRNQLVDRAIVVMEKITTGDTTPSGKHTTVKMVNGVTEKIEVVTISEVKELEGLKEEYQTLTMYLLKIIANHPIEAIVSTPSVAEATADKPVN